MKIWDNYHERKRSDLRAHKFRYQGMMEKRSKKTMFALFCFILTFNFLTAQEYKILSIDSTDLNYLIKVSDVQVGDTQLLMSPIDSSCLRIAPTKLCIDSTYLLNTRNYCDTSVLSVQYKLAIRIGTNTVFEVDEGDFRKIPLVSDDLIGLYFIVHPHEYEQKALDFLFNKENIGDEFRSVIYFSGFSETEKSDVYWMAHTLKKINYIFGDSTFDNYLDSINNSLMVRKYKLHLKNKNVKHICFPKMIHKCSFVLRVYNMVDMFNKQYVLIRVSNGCTLDAYFVVEFDKRQNSIGFYKTGLHIDSFKT